MPVLTAGAVAARILLAAAFVGLSVQAYRAQSPKAKALAAAATTCTSSGFLPGPTATRLKARREM